MNPSTGTQAPTTSNAITSGANLQKGSRQKGWLGLETFQDPALINLEELALEWWERFFAKDRPCWLTLAGTSEVGKTFVASALWHAAIRNQRVHLPPRFEKYVPQKIWWPGFVNKLRGGDHYDVLEDTGRWPLLFLDEIGASRDTTGFVADQLYTILAQRDHRWTIITTNLTMDALAKVDERIVSRCFRYDGIVVETNTVPFSQRAR